jgi:peptide chain release factor subunit 1
MTVITEAAIKELAGFKSTEAPVVSCYLDVDGRRQIRPQDYQRRLEAMVKTAAAEHDVTVSADLAQITRHVNNGVDRHGVRGLAIFSCAAKGLWEVVSLPVPVANRILVNHSPAVGPLEAIVHELEPLGVLLVDRQRARMFVFQFGAVVERSQLFEALPRDYDRRDDAGRGSREREQHHVDELALQHLRHSAEVAFRHFQDRGFGRLSIGATDDVYAATEHVLHPYLRERLAPRIHVTVTATEPEISAAALVIEHQIEQERETAIVSRLRDAVGAKAKGAAGLGDVLGALNERRVATLVVSNGFVESGWLCACGALAAKGPTCPVDGATMERVDDVVSEAVDVALGEGAHVEMCESNADLDVMGRVGALLRY